MRGNVTLLTLVLLTLTPMYGVRSATVNPVQSAPNNQNLIRLDSSSFRAMVQKI